MTDLSLVQNMHFPNNHFIPSEIEGFWKPFTRVFQLLCVSHFTVYRAKFRDNYLKTLPLLIYFLTFSTIHIALLAYDLNKGLHEGHTHPHHTIHKESPLMLYVNCLSIFGRFVTHIITHLETLLNGKREKEIHRRLKKINNIFKSKLNYSTDFNAKRKRYVRGTVSVFVIATLLTVASSLFRVPISNHDKFFSQTIFIFAIIIIRARGCYIALILNIITDILGDLQVLLKQQQTKSRQSTRDEAGINYKRENVRYLREIYSNVWLVKTMLSDCCGWSLITFLIEFSIELINSSYWFYINFYSHASNNLSIRKIIRNELTFRIQFDKQYFQILCCTTVRLQWFFGTFVGCRKDAKIW